MFELSFFLLKSPLKNRLPFLFSWTFNLISVQHNYPFTFYHLHNLFTFFRITILYIWPVSGDT